MGCLSYQVKLTRALNEELHQAMKDIHKLGDHGEEASQRITELESLYKQQEETIMNLKKENATLEQMVRSNDELIMEIATETRLDRMGDDDHEDDDVDDSEGEDDDDDRGDAAAPLATVPPADIAFAIATEEEEDSEMMILEQEAPEALEVILLDKEP
jgi:hypothetical protein